MLRAEARRQQPGLWFAGIARQAFAHDPARAFRNRSEVSIRQRFARQRDEAVEGPNRFTVRIPLAFLGEVIAVAPLARSELLQGTAGAIDAAQREQHVQNKRRISKPESLVR